MLQTRVVRLQLPPDIESLLKYLFVTDAECGDMYRSACLAEPCCIFQTRSTLCVNRMVLNPMAPQALTGFSVH